jgi:hypothetical protein
VARILIFWVKRDAECYALVGTEEEVVEEGKLL